MRSAAGLNRMNLPCASATTTPSPMLSRIDWRMLFCCRRFLSASLFWVMSRAILDTPINRPSRSRRGEIVMDTSTCVPSLRSRTVSYCCSAWPLDCRSCIQSSSSFFSGGTRREKWRPMTSWDSQPKTRCAAAFHELMMPSGVCDRMASSEDSTMAASRCVASSRLLRFLRRAASCISRSMVGARRASLSLKR